MSNSYPNLDHAIYQAVSEGRDVRLEQCDGYGYAISVDGTTLLTGVPRETLSCPLDRVDFDESAEALVNELLENRENRLAQNKRARERERSESYRAAHGADLPPRGGSA